MRSPGADFQRFDLARDGRWLAIAGHNRSVLLDLSHPGTPIDFARGHRQSHVAISPDSRRVAAASYHGIGVTVWSTQDGTMLRHVITNENAEVAFTPDGTIVTTTARECAFWQADTWQKLGSIELNLASGVPAALAAGGGYIAFVASRQTIVLLDARTRSELAVLRPPVPERISELHFSPDGGHLVAIAGKRTLHLWDLHSLRRELSTMNLDW